MPTDWQLDDVNSDIVITDGEPQVVTDNDESVRQRLILKLSMNKGNWWLNTNFGTDYMGSILGAKSKNWVAVNAAFIDAIVSTPGVLQLNKPIEYNLDNSDRLLSVTFEAQLDSGDAITLTVGMSP